MRGLLAFVFLVFLAVPSFAANDFSANPWSLDTAGAGNVQDGNIKVTCIRWVGASAAGQQAILRDGSNKVIWEEIAPGPNFSTQECGLFMFLGGVRLTTLGAGKVYLYVP